MHGHNVIRAILFVLFFSIGAAALGGAVLVDELVRHYQDKHILRQARLLTDRLRSLNEDYDALLRRLEEDPNLIRRIAPAAIGAKRDDPNVVNPRATAEELDAAKTALMKDVENSPAEPNMPRWLIRCRASRERTILFASGALLVLISFVCFRPVKPPAARGSLAAE